MPARESLRGADVCDLAVRWRVAPEVIARLVVAADQFYEETRGTVQIISGYRTYDEQVRLGRAGRPAARDDLSTHRSCPATGVDVNIGTVPTRVQKAIWGRILRMNGLRWGGGSAPNEAGIPSDWQHVDMGPRALSQALLGYVVPVETGRPTGETARVGDRERPRLSIRTRTGTVRPASPRGRATITLVKAR